MCELLFSEDQSYGMLQDFLVLIALRVSRILAETTTWLDLTTSKVLHALQSLA